MVIAIGTALGNPTIRLSSHGVSTTVKGDPIMNHIDRSIGSAFNGIIGYINILQQLNRIARLSICEGVRQHAIILGTDLSHSFSFIEILNLQSILQLDIISRSHSSSTGDRCSIITIRHSTNYSFLKCFIRFFIPNGQSIGLAISRVYNFASIRQACKEFSQPDIKTVGGINNRTIAVIIIDNHRINSRIINLLDEVYNALSGICNPFSISFIIILIGDTEVISDSYTISLDIQNRILTGLFLCRKHQINSILDKVINGILILRIIDCSDVIVCIRGIEQILAHTFNKALNLLSKGSDIKSRYLVVSRTYFLKDRILNSSNHSINYLKDHILLSTLIDRITMEDAIGSAFRHRRLRRNMRYRRIVRTGMHRNHSMITNILGPFHNHFFLALIDETCIHKHLIDYLLKVSHVIQTLQELDIPEEPSTDLVRPSSTRNGTIKVNCDLMD